jgi:hypothetical protein
LEFHPFNTGDPKHPCLSKHHQRNHENSGDCLLKNFLREMLPWLNHPPSKHVMLEWVHQVKWLRLGCIQYQCSKSIWWISSSRQSYHGPNCESTQGILFGFQSHIIQLKNQDDDDTVNDHRSKVDAKAVKC